MYLEEYIIQQLKNKLQYKDQAFIYLIFISMEEKEADINNSCMIIITSKDLNTIEHILETMTKTKFNVDSNQFNMTSSGLVLTNSTNNTTDNNQTTTTTKKTTSSKSSSSSSSNSGYRWSEQYGDYIKEYTDSNGIQHIDSKKGYKSSYNPRTGELKEKNYDKLL